MLGLCTQWGRFNPLPAFGPGDTALRYASAPVMPVSIRSRLLGREIPHIYTLLSKSKIVSIRSRLLGREIHIDGIEIKKL